MSGQPGWLSLVGHFVSQFRRLGLDPLVGHQIKAIRRASYIIAPSEIFFVKKSAFWAPQSASILKNPKPMLTN